MGIIAPDGRPFNESETDNKSEIDTQRVRGLCVSARLVAALATSINRRGRDFVFTFPLRAGRSAHTSVARK